MSTQIGTKIDVHAFDENEQSEGWWTAKVINKTSRSIVVKYDDDNTLETLNNEILKERILPINTMTIPIHAKISFNHNLHSSLSNARSIQQIAFNESILFFVHSLGRIHQFNTTTFEWNIFAIYPETFDVGNIRHIALDDELQRIHFFDYAQKHIIFDICSKEWTVSNTKRMRYFGLIDTYFINGSLHCFEMDRYHYILNETDNYLEDVSQKPDAKYSNLYFVSNNMVYYEPKDWILNVFDDGFLYYLSRCPNDNEWKWQCSNIKLWDTNNADYASFKHMILCFEHILIVFDAILQQIVCVDLLHNVQFNVKRRISECLSIDSSIGQANDGYLYVFDHVNHLHLKMNVLDFIPMEMDNWHRSNLHYHKLIAVYVQKLKIKTSNKDIEQLILSFYPIFML